MQKNPIVTGLLGTILGMCIMVFLLTLPVFCSRSTSIVDTLMVERNDTIRDTVYVDCLPNGSITYNLPCRAVNLNQDQPGKSILFIWLHGGVYVSNLHDLNGWNHLNCCEADDNIMSYLERKGLKAVALFPICHKATVNHCIAWKDCFEDIKVIIDDYVAKGLVDPERIYLAGSSDGGTGAWDYAEWHGDVFAAIMPMSCGNPRMSSVPVYFFNTKNEGNYSAQVASLNANGCNIRYKHCSDVGHGGDARECTDEFLDEFFSNIKGQ